MKAKEIQPASPPSVCDAATVAYIAVGSNIEPERHVLRALEHLACRVRITGVSTFYRTPAIGTADQADYLNGVVRIETPLSPRELKFGVLREIEAQEGRVRSGDKYGPRTIDLDLALYGDLVIMDEDLTVPAPEIETRVFVSVPLCELDPDLRLPGKGTRIADLVGEADRQSLRPQIEFTQTLRQRLGIDLDGQRRPLEK